MNANRRRVSTKALGRLFIIQKVRLSHSVLLACFGWLVVAGAHAQTCTTAPAGLVSWWQGENSTADAMGGNNGTIAGTGLVTYGPGVVGQAFVFDGTHRDRIDLGNPVSLQLQDFTLGAWVKRSSPTNTSFDVLGGDGSDCGDGACIIGYGRGGYILAIANDGRLILSRTDIDGVISAPLITDLNWHHLAVTKAGTNAVFYVDGQPQATPPYVPHSPYTFDDGTCSCNAAIAIGSRGDARGGTFYGAIDEPAVFNRSLTPEEIQTIYAAGGTGMCPPNNWTNQFSDKWESPSWSLGVLPASDQIVRIMNDGYKAVNIDSATVAEFSDSLTVGSLEVGAPTNALSTLLLNYFGLNTPLKVLNTCAIENNGTLLNLSSGFEVDGTNGGALTIDGGTFTQEGGLTLVNAPVLVRSGSMNATNGDLTLGEVTLGTANSAGYFGQDGGSIAAQRLTIEQGSYVLYSGILYGIGGTETDGSGAYMQWDGTNYGDITVNAACTIDGGMAQGNVLTIQGRFYQGGGVVDMQTVDWTGNQGNVLSLGTLRSKVINIHANALVFMGQVNIVPGSVETDSLSISNGAHVEVGGYDLFVTNSLDMHGESANSTANLDLISSMVTVGAFNTYDYSRIEQYGPTTTELANGLSMYGGQYLLEAGLLEGPYVGIGANATFSHSGGENLVHGVLSITGTYDISAGSLVADGIYLRGSLLLQFQQGSHSVISFTNNGLMDLGGRIGIGTTNVWGGQVELATNAVIDFIGMPAQLRFAASSDVAWTPGASLVLTNWNNSGNTRLFFGNDASALTASQLAQIQFANPGGFAPGTYPAQLLSTGELVPAGRPTLQMARTASALVFTWSGNYQLLSSTNVVGPYNPIPGASSPWTNFFIKPQEFFLLQGP